MNQSVAAPELDFIELVGKLRKFRIKTLDRVLSIENKIITAMISIDNLTIYATLEPISDNYQIINCITYMSHFYLQCWFQPDFYWYLIFNDDHVLFVRRQLTRTEPRNSYKIIFDLRTRDFNISWHEIGSTVWTELANYESGKIKLPLIRTSIGCPHSISFETDEKAKLPFGNFWHMYRDTSYYEYRAPLSDRYGEAIAMQKKYGAAMMQEKYKVVESKNVNISEAYNSDINCVACTAQKKNMIAIKCGHLCYCGACSNKQTKCPICRAETTFMKVYF